MQFKIQALKNLIQKIMIIQPLKILLEIIVFQLLTLSRKYLLATLHI